VRELDVSASAGIEAQFLLGGVGGNESGERELLRQKRVNQRREAFGERAAREPSQ